jgi:hypothetical protein
MGLSSTKHTHKHTHQSFVDGCYPCELIQQRDELRAENERLRIELHRVAESRRGQRERAERLRAQVEETAKECGLQKTDNERLRAELRGFICEECLKPLGRGKDG